MAAKALVDKIGPAAGKEGSGRGLRRVPGESSREPGVRPQEDTQRRTPAGQQLLWARALGRITSIPVVRGDRVYVANDVGTLYSIHDSGAAGLDRTVAIEPGGVKGFIFPGRSSQDNHFSTAGLVRAETDTPTFFSPKCGYGGGGLAPSPVLFVAALGKVYFGGNDGKLYELDAAACGAPKSGRCWANRS